nr:MAG TPA: hypothetical protein [Caudoviricetes sp.]
MIDRGCISPHLLYHIAVQNTIDDCFNWDGLFIHTIYGTLTKSKRIVKNLTITYSATRAGLSTVSTWFSTSPFSW